MKAELQNINWEQKMEGRTVEEMWNGLKDIYEQQQEKYVPIREQKNNNKQRWTTRAVIKLMRKKRKAWKRWKLLGTNETEKHYKEIQKTLKSELKKAKRDFQRKMASKIKEDPKSFYAYIRSKQKVKEKVGLIKDEQGKIISTEKETVETLNKFFHKVFTRENDNIPAIEVVNANHETKLKNIDITEEMVYKKLNEIQRGKSAGPDNMSTDYLKEMAHQLEKPLTMIYQKSLDRLHKSQRTGRNQTSHRYLKKGRDQMSVITGQLT